MAGLSTKGGGIGSAANPFSRQGTLVRVSKSVLRSSWAQRKACSGSGRRDKQFRCSRKINLSISVLVLSYSRIQFAIADASLSVGPRTKVQASIAFTLPITSDSFVFECAPHKHYQPTNIPPAAVRLCRRFAPRSSSLVETSPANCTASRQAICGNSNPVTTPRHAAGVDHQPSPGSSNLVLAEQYPSD
jgi:hypothetical protein